MKIFTHTHFPFWIISGAATAIVFFLGTLYFTDSIDKPLPAPSSDAIRAENARSIIFALQTFRHEKGVYPIRLDKEIKELTDPLVKDGFIDAIPVDPSDEEPTRYVSDGKAFGLRIHQKSGICIVEIGVKETGWWGQPPPCEL